MAGAYLIDIEALADERGFFARTFCAEEMRAHGLNGDVAQCNVSRNKAKHTLRGLHFQAAPAEEDKLVRCAAGAIYDVIVDLRRDGPSFGRWFGAELTAANHRALYVPKGFAHGFLTLEDDTEVFYQMSTPFAPGCGRGLRWDDASVGIAWPAAPVVMSERDADYPGLADLEGL